jgi:hypothetical protein
MFTFIGVSISPKVKMHGKRMLKKIIKKTRNNREWEKYTTLSLIIFTREEILLGRSNSG